MGDKSPEYLKKYVLMVSKNLRDFDYKLPKPTFFKEKIVNKEKIHTLRNNLIYWRRIEKAIKKGKGVLSLREWIDKPYRSKQIEFLQLNKIHIQPITITNCASLVWLNDRYLNKWEIEKLAHNDGLSLSDFEKWFSKDFDGAIIHFTDFKYN